LALALALAGFFLFDGVDGVRDVSFISNTIMLLSVATIQPPDSISVAGRLGVVGFSIMESIQTSF